MSIIGIVGEYVGKIYLEAKGRPRFLVDEILDETAAPAEGGCAGGKRP